MRRRGIWVLVMLATVVAAFGAAGTASAANEKVLKIGWAQEAGTLNPFVGQDAQDYDIWAINYDYLIGSSPTNLGPVPGIAQTWKVSADRKTVTYKIIQGAKWSDGQPITSADVKWTFDTLGRKGALFSGYLENVKTVTAPDTDTIVLTMTQPDTRVIGGLALPILPKHVWAKQSISSLTGNYQPKLPLVGSGPYVVSKWSRNHILQMVRNPNFRGTKPAYDELAFIKYGSQDAVDRALQTGEIDFDGHQSSSSAGRLAKLKNVQVISAAAGAYDELAFNLCPTSICPNGKVNPAIQDRTVRQAIAYAVDRQKINEIAYRGTAFPGNGILPSYYKSFYTQPAENYPLDVAKANQMLDKAGWKKGSGGVRTKGSERLEFSLYTRSESPDNTQAGRLIVEMAKAIGVKFDLQVVSTSKLTDLTANMVKGKRAPQFDTFIWGWAGDVYDPSLLLNILTTGAIATQTSDSFYHNPAYDRLYTQQSGEFDVAKRKAEIAQMTAMTQRDLPYLVLVETPALEAYRTDRIANARRVCPAGTGDILCLEVGYAPFEWLKPVTKGAAATQGSGGIQTTASSTPAAALGSSGGSSGGSSTGWIIGIVIAVIVVGGVVLVVVRRRKVEEDELEDEV